MENHNLFLLFTVNKQLQVHQDGWSNLVVVYSYPMGYSRNIIQQNSMFFLNMCCCIHIIFSNNKVFQHMNGII